jgi:hypothetical protein
LATAADQKIAAEARQQLSWMAQNNREASAVRYAAFSAYLGERISVGHVFVSYVHEDLSDVERLIRGLERRGVSLWHDKVNLRPGEHWRLQISDAIRAGNAFLAVFSQNSESRERSYMREELLEAVDELRRRPLDRAWFFSVLLSPCRLPKVRIGPGEYLEALQYVPLYEEWETSLDRLAVGLQSAVLSP